MALDLHLRIRKLLVELLQVGHRLDHERLLRDVAQRLGYHFVEAPRLLDQLLLHREQVPVLPYRLEQIVEELIELFPQVVPDEKYMVPQVDLVLAQGGANRLIQDRLTILDLLQ